MKIVLGSSNDDKANILKETLREEFGEPVKVVKVSVPSKISDQPLSEKETFKGAVNRVKDALAQRSAAEIAVGLETGLVKIKGSSLLPLF